MEQWRCREEGNTGWNWVEAENAQGAAEVFSEEYGIDDNTIVEVAHNGRYPVTVVNEYMVEKI